MLAPRKTLWSTPGPVVETLVRWTPLEPGDVVCDIGCGDGRVLLHWATAVSTMLTCSVSFIGIELDPERAKLAQDNIQQAYASGAISPTVKVKIFCANALDATHLYEHANVFFLYLIPRGLRLILPVLEELAAKRQPEATVLKVVSYMSPLPHVPLVAKALCSVDHQPGAAWPLYLYHLCPSSSTTSELESNVLRETRGN